MIPDDFKQQLLGRIDIVDVVERHVPLRKAGHNYLARCPFHNEKTPSFTVSATKQFYHCFGCGAHGNAVTFLMEYLGLGYVDAVKDLAAMAGLSLPETRPPSSTRIDARESAGIADVLATAARHYKTELKRSERAIGYLKNRGLTGEIAARFGLGYAPAGWQGLAAVFSDYARSEALAEAGLVIDAEGGRRYDRFRERVMFPILDVRGGVIGFGGRVLDGSEPKYLNSPETTLFEKGRELYGLFQARQAIREAGCAVVVEGYMDVVALAQHGIGYAVATLGTATTPVHVQKLLRQTDRLVFAFDGDAAGRKAAWRAAENCLAQMVDGKQVGFLFLPDGEDPDSYVRAGGREAFEARLAAAIPLSEFLLRELVGQVEMGTPEGRARLLHLAKPLVTQAASGARAFGLMFRRRLAEVARVDLAELDELFEIKRVPTGPERRRGPSRPTRTAPATPGRRILQAVLQEPRLAARLDRGVLDPADAWYAPLASVLDLLAAHPDLDGRDVVPMALEALRGGGAAERLHEAHADLLATAALDVEAEFLHAVGTLEEQLRSRRLAELTSLPRRSTLEQAELERLLKCLSDRARNASEGAV